MNHRDNNFNINKYNMSILFNIPSEYKHIKFKHSKSIKLKLDDIGYEKPPIYNKKKGFLFFHTIKLNLYYVNKYRKWSKIQLDKNNIQIII